VCDLVLSHPLTVRDCFSHPPHCEWTCSLSLPHCVWPFLSPPSLCM